jgi:hypothetical protein
MTSYLSKNSTVPKNFKDTWNPLEINEFDEIERLQGLKQRENMLKGMGVKDIITKVLTGMN